jgi:hypothetical protein
MAKFKPAGFFTLKIPARQGGSAVIVVMRYKIIVSAGSFFYL